MKVSIPWLKELVDLNISFEELINLLPLRSISIKEVMNSYIELDMKGYNRTDLLSMRGIAYEIAAITGSKVSFTEPEEVEFFWNKAGLPTAKVTVSDPKYAPFYTVTKIEGLKVEASPEEWIKKLKSCGLRSIDNITDITNLIMLEYGQPMHAFDARAVKDETIIVRCAKKGERITTLDGKTRDLQVADLLITDPQNPLGIAGVMGGKDSEINETTTTILLEAAIFDPVNIRKTVTHLGLPSEASKRFQHGLTKKRLLQALNAAIKMYQKLGGKVAAVTIVGDYEDTDRIIELSSHRLNSLVGIEFRVEEVENYLHQLNFNLKRVGANVNHPPGGIAWHVHPPFYRLDIEIEEDVIEEVARMYGYEKIPAVKVSEIKPLQKENPIFKTIDDLKQTLVDLGLTEVQTYSFFSTDVLNNFNANKDDLIRVANPISSETEYLRDWISPNLVEVVGKNLRQGFKDIAVFEIGKAFTVGTAGLPDENYRLAIALCNGTDNPLAELYQIAQNLPFHLKGVKLTHPKGVQVFHPKRQMDCLAEVHLRILNKLGIEKRVAVLEIGLESNSHSN